ncbi:unnamed protein product [Schistocephalus solidus]|uniref:Protein kinase domain-containing protein n=1 Tax=Schistocephalus solidus TaxID=70667 RepID=A0A183S806_SCHSO|nr:unnamed protein product [Schistocephalus solidus]
MKHSIGMQSKRSKRSLSMHSPSSSTPAYLRHGFTASPRSLFDSITVGGKDSDADLSVDSFTENSSPTAPRFRISGLKNSPLELDAPTLASHSQAVKLSDESSPDNSYSVEDISARLSMNTSCLSDHLQHSLSYAKTLELRAAHLSNRLSTSANLSMSPRLLFASETATPKVEDQVYDYRRRNAIVDDMNMQACASISQQTVSSVDRILRFSEVCPEVLNNQTPNRFVSKLRHGFKKPEIPYLFSLIGSFSSLEELSRTQLAVLYKGRHRLSGVVYCLKRSRCEFELERSHGGTISEIFNEVQALALLQHPNIVRYFSSWFEADSIFLKLEYCLGGSLFNYLHPHRSTDTSEVVMDRLSANSLSPENGSIPPAEESSPRHLSESVLTVLAVHITSALYYMHTSWSMVHGDVKPSNILIQLEKPELYLASARDKADREAKELCHTLLQNGDISGFVFKLSDYGRASKAGEDRDGENLGDGRYLPRLNDPSPPACAAIGRDVYALGITLYHAVGAIAGGPMDSSVWERLRETDSLPDFSVIPASLQQLVRSMLRPLAQDRPTTSELLTWPSFRPYLHVPNNGKSSCV